YQHWVFRQFTDADTWADLAKIQDCYNANANPEVACVNVRPAKFWTALREALVLPPGKQMHLVDNGDWNLDPNGGGAFAAASLESMNAILQILQTPEPGSFVDLNDFKASPPPMTPDPYSNDYRAENKIALVSTDPGALAACTTATASIRAND